MVLLSAMDPDSTYNSDIESSARDDNDEPQYQAPRAKKFMVTKLKNSKQTRYPEGDYIEIEICCELKPLECIKYGGVYPNHDSSSGIKMTHGLTEETIFTNHLEELECSVG